MPWKGYSMYFITRKTHPLDSKLRQENSSSEPSDRWCPCVPGTFEPVVTRSAAALEVERSSESGGATLPAEVFHRIDRSISEFSCQFFLKSISNSYTISPPLASSTSWQLANLFGWKHHYSDPKLTAEEALRNGALSTNCLYLFATD